MTTWALGTVAPYASVTVPSNDPLTACEKAKLAQHSAKESKMHIERRRCMRNPLFCCIIPNSS
jgi:hypothetical protein